MMTKGTGGYAYSAAATRIPFPPGDAVYATTVLVYVQDNVVVNHWFRGGGPGLPPHNYNYEFSDKLQASWSDEEKNALFQFDLLKPPPERAWYVEPPQSNLYLREGYWYEYGASKPFTGVLSTFYRDRRKASECHYEMGLRHGPCTLWRHDGAIYRATNFEYGSPVPGDVE